MITRVLVGMLLLTACCLARAREGDAGTIYAPAAFLGPVAVKVTSLKELKFRRTVQQQYDFSCGSAALATLLTYHYEDRVPEAEIFMAMYNAGDKDKIRREGFSLLDMKNYLQRRGYQSDGFKISLDKVRQVGVPALVLISNHGYKHFVVLKGVAARTVLLGDPALGARVMARKEFEESWNGLVFLVRSHKEVAVRHFNQAAEWPSSGRLTNFVPLVSDRLLSPTLYMSIIGGH
ncbi:MAG: C39 family peptidase [Oryzomonas sp.]|uniref:C39 family peptidase n=1 Tax=Oryzomonas sp. TaxID=2855186 RepID=UPI002844ECCB|nr:C39 family peptidase [Oryzomonas sp.]MDR3578682.1 C39 family peptidase [Oryzomonas sp.]